MEIKIVNKLAWDLSRTSKASFEDLQSEGIIAYLEAEKSFNAAIGALSTTYAYRCVKNRMIDFIVYENRFFSLDKDLPELGSNPQPFFEIKDSLSDAAKYVVDLVLAHYPKYLSNSGWKARGEIRKDLFEEGWSDYKITKTIVELKAAFN